VACNKVVGLARRPATRNSDAHTAFGIDAQDVSPGAPTADERDWPGARISDGRCVLDASRCRLTCGRTGVTRRGIIAERQRQLHPANMLRHQAAVDERTRPGGTREDSHTVVPSVPRRLGVVLFRTSQPKGC